MRIVATLLNRAVGFALLGWSVGASAQVIAPDSEPAQTIESYPTIVLGEPAPRGSRPRISLQLESALRYSSNVLGVSNLPGGLELEGEGGMMWDKGARVVGTFPVGEGLLLYAHAGLSHTNYLKRSNLDYFDLAGGVGAIYALSNKTNVSLAFDCSSERDSGFNEYYQICRPSAAFTTAVGNPYSRTGLEFGVRGALGLGSESRFARYREASAWMSFETGRAVRFQLRPEGRVRDYDLPASLSILGDKRTDYQASVRAALFYRANRVTFGVEVVPRANWSNLAQYRYWEVQGGPFIRVRI